MDSTDRQLLLRDARVLAWYAARNGKLPPTNRVFELIAKYEDDLTPSPELIMQLHSEMDAISKAIAPTTLGHLLQRGSLIGFTRHAISSITPFALGLLTLLLTLYLAFESSQLNQADTAIREYQSWVDQQPGEKLYDAWKMYRYERVLNLKGPPLAQLDAYHKLEDDARQLVDKGAAIQALLIDSGSLLYFPRFLEEIGPSFLRDFVRSANGDELPSADIQQKLKAIPGIRPAGSGVVAGGTSGLTPQADCKDSQPAIDTRAASTKQEQQSADIDAYFNSIDCFLSRLHRSDVTMYYSPWFNIYHIKAKINLLVTWLLPGLYGLLGACVFLLRDLVLTRDGKLSRDKRIVSMLLLLLRIALGGLAGIIIGWFWVPAPIGNSNSVVLPISSIPFGLAFMAGFSIDTLFSLLDRVNSMIENRAAATRQNEAIPSEPTADANHRATAAQ